MAKNVRKSQRERFVLIPSNGVLLEGSLAVPPNAIGVVLFAHGSGSSRFSPRNTFVARVLQGGGLATLLFDLLTAEESEDRSYVFDIELLAGRLRDATNWVRQQPETQGLPIGYFGASTGAAAALVAAAEEGEGIRAVVSRGGRPDLAGRFLADVKAPTLLIVGGNDEPVIALNEEASRDMKCPNELKIIPGATHLFEEPGALEQVAQLAREWFKLYLPMAAKRVA